MGENDASNKRQTSDDLSEKDAKEEVVEAV